MNEQLRRRRRRIRTLAVGFVLLYALASVRTLVPGLCATQAALAHGESGIVPANCCARPSGSPERQHDADQPLRPKQRRCAFCQLALGICMPAPYAADGAAQALVSAVEYPDPVGIPATEALDTNVGRDPPAIRFS
jgi:hypothetical protein